MTRARYFTPKGDAGVVQELKCFESWRRARQEEDGKMDLDDLLAAIEAAMNDEGFATSDAVKDQLDAAGINWGQPTGFRMNELDRQLRGNPNAPYIPYKMGPNRNSQVVFVRPESAAAADARGWVMAGVAPISWTPRVAEMSYRLGGVHEEATAEVQAGIQGATRSNCA